MSAGVQPSVGGINSQVAAMAISLRDDFQRIANFQAWLNTVGSAGLVALGFTAPDAAVIVSSMGNLATLSAIYQGTATGPAFNYMANTEPLWGGN